MLWINLAITGSGHWTICPHLISSSRRTWLGHQLLTDFFPFKFPNPKFRIVGIFSIIYHRENWHLLTWKWFLGSTQLLNNWFASTSIWIVQNECVQIWKSDQVSGTWQGLVQKILSFLVGRILSRTSIEKIKYEAKPMDVKNNLLWNYKYPLN